jgi:hypothetical protein
MGSSDCTPALDWEAAKAFIRSAEPLCIPALDWEAAKAFIQSAVGLIAPRRQRFLELLNVWDARLQDLKGDPSSRDWRSFRPLRLGKEPTWSDWLGHLLQTADGPDFERTLLGAQVAPPRQVWSPPEVRREELARDEEGRRFADLVIVWPERFCDVEVKVGDTNFDKTFDTADKLERNLGRARPWSHFILLPPEHVDLWRECERRKRTATTVALLTWREVAIALRRALLTSSDLSWRVWAHSYCGAIEQQLLHHPWVPASRRTEFFSSTAQLWTLVDIIDLVEEATS